MQLFFIKFNKTKHGFTLIETLVALSIFSTSVLGIFAVLTQGISNTRHAQEKIVAAYLAQEGIEYIRNMRDTYVLYNATDTQTGWNDFNAKLTSSACGSQNGCYIDDQNLDYENHTQQMVTVDTLFACSSACPLLKYDATTGKYSVATGENSAYTRKIERVVASADETKIISHISWTQGSGSFTISLSESLFNWVE